MLSPADIKNRFGYHQPRTAERVADHEQVRAICARAAEQLATVLPAGREAACAYTALEQAMFWANAAVARQGQDPDE